MPLIKYTLVLKCKQKSPYGNKIRDPHNTGRAQAVYFRGVKIHLIALISVRDMIMHSN